MPITLSTVQRVPSRSTNTIDYLDDVVYMYCSPNNASYGLFSHQRVECCTIGHSTESGEKFVSNEK